MNMINNNIDNLIHDTSQKLIYIIIHLPIPAIVIPLEWWVGVISVYFLYKLIQFLYIKFMTVRIKNKQYLKYYSPMKLDFFNFLNIVRKHTDKFSVVRTTLKAENLSCQNISRSNKELECIFNYIVWFPLYKIDVILSTLYDDGYDLIKIRTIEDIYKAEYIKTIELNELIISLKNGLELFKITMIGLNNQSINDFGIPISQTYQDVIDHYNKRIQKLVVVSIDWK